MGALMFAFVVGITAGVVLTPFTIMWVKEWQDAVHEEEAARGKPKKGVITTVKSFPCCGKHYLSGARVDSHRKVGMSAYNLAIPLTLFSNFFDAELIENARVIQEGGVLPHDPVMLPAVNVPNGLEEGSNYVELYVILVSQFTCDSVVIPNYHKFRHALQSYTGRDAQVMRLLHRIDVLKQAEVFTLAVEAPQPTSLYVVGHTMAGKSLFLNRAVGTSCKVGDGTSSTTFACQGSRHNWVNHHDSIGYRGGGGRPLEQDLRREHMTCLQAGMSTPHGNRVLFINPSHTTRAFNELTLRLEQSFTPHGRGVVVVTVTDQKFGVYSVGLDSLDPQPDLVGLSAATALDAVKKLRVPNPSLMFYKKLEDFDSHEFTTDQVQLMTAVDGFETPLCISVRTAPDVRSPSVQDDLKTALARIARLENRQRELLMEKQKLSDSLQQLQAQPANRPLTDDQAELDQLRLDLESAHTGNVQLTATANHLFTRVSAAERLLTDTLAGLLSISDHPIVWPSWSAIVADLQASVVDEGDSVLAIRRSLTYSMFVKHLEPQCIPAVWLPSKTGLIVMQRCIPVRAFLPLTMGTKHESDPRGLSLPTNTVAYSKRLFGARSALIICQDRIWMVDAPKLVGPLQLVFGLTPLAG